jgi:4-amino-4-deoxy-L-arabinose transferase-like glycosyltransferase
MPYAVMYAFGGDAVGLVASKFSIWPVFLAILSLLWRCARRLGLSADAVWLFVAFGATSTAVTLTAWDGKTDLIALMYALGAVLWMPGLVSSQPDQRQFFLFGFMSACAFMAKLPYALVLPFCLGILLLFLWWKHWPILLRILIISGVAACLAFTLGWWAKNFFVFGDPFAPILTLRAGTPRFNLEQVWFDANNIKWILTTYPLALTFGLYPMQHGGISPIWLMLVPTLWMRPWQSESGRKALYLGLGGVAGILAWAVLRPSVIAPRYFLPALLLPGLILVAGYERWLSERRAWAAAVLVAVMALVTLHVEYVSTVYRYVTLPFVSALKGGVGTTPALDRARRLASDPRPNVKVFLLSYSSEFLPSHMLTSFLPYRSIKKNKNALEWALREKVDYIVYDPITHKRGDLDVPPPPGLLVEKLEFAPNVYYLYVLTRTGDAR